MATIKDAKELITKIHLSIDWLGATGKFIKMHFSLLKKFNETVLNESAVTPSDKNSRKRNIKLGNESQKIFDQMKSHFEKATNFKI